MDTNGFDVLYDNLKKHISEIKSTIKQKDLWELSNQTKILERTKYLFYSVTKSLIDVGHGIILENNFRAPVNRADIFISLAERAVIAPSIIPGIKRAVLTLPKINNYQYVEVLKIMSESIDDLHACLDCFSSYFKMKEKKK